MNSRKLRPLIDHFCSPFVPNDLDSVRQLGELLREEELTCVELEQMLRQGPILQRPANIQPGKLFGKIPLPCIHLNYETTFFLYVPNAYSEKHPSPFLLIGHGGNGSMSRSYAESTAQMAIQDWIPIAEQYGFILAAPATTRGWGNIGYSIVSSLRSQLQRWFRLDPDRMYLTGHSMGGHLSWRSAIYIGDRWGAVAPMSGGYDYVEKGLMKMLFNVPGYVTFGKQEPYGIADANRNMRSWLQAHDFEWIVQEKSGGHEIFFDELPKVAEFFLKHPRNLYRIQVWGEAWQYDRWEEPDEQWKRYHQWHPKRYIPHGSFHWLRLWADKTLPPGNRQRVFAKIDRRDNVIFLESEHVKKVSLYVHPHLIDLEREVQIVANGDIVFSGLIETDVVTMLDTVREFDDWGRLFWAKQDVEIKTSYPPRLGKQLS